MALHRQRWLCPRFLVGLADELRATVYHAGYIIQAPCSCAWRFDSHGETTIRSSSRPSPAKEASADQSKHQSGNFASQADGVGMKPKESHGVSAPKKREENIDFRETPSSLFGNKVSGASHQKTFGDKVARSRHGSSTDKEAAAA